MFIKLPIIEYIQDKETQETHAQKEYITVSLDTTIKAHYKWECEFLPVLGVSFSEYFERLQAQQLENKTDILAFLKLLYCMIEHPKITTFKEFLGIFNIQNTEEILTIITDTLRAIANTSTNKKKSLNG